MGLYVAIAVGVCFALLVFGPWMKKMDRNYAAARAAEKERLARESESASNPDALKNWRTGPPVDVPGAEWVAPIGMIGIGALVGALVASQIVAPFFLLIAFACSVVCGALKRPAWCLGLLTLTVVIGGVWLDSQMKLEADLKEAQRQIDASMKQLGQ